MAAHQTKSENFAESRNPIVNDELDFKRRDYYRSLPMACFRACAGFKQAITMRIVYHRFLDFQRSRVI